MEEICSCLISYISIFGPPKEILSDRGKEFVNKLIDGLCDRLKINRRITSAYNPRSNGLTERFNQTLTGALRKQSSEHPDKWVDYLPYVLMAYRTRIHSSTNFSPFELMFGRKMTTFDNWSSTNDDEVTPLIKRSVEIKKLAEETIPLAIKNIDVSQKRQEIIQNKQNKVHINEPNKLKVGDTVFIKSEKIQNKFEPIYNSPFFEKITEGGNYVLKDNSQNILQDSYPRWRLKLQDTAPETLVIEEEKSSDNKNKYYDIEKILEHKRVGRGYKYLVKWKGEPSSKNSWIPGSYFQDKSVLEQYHNKKSSNEAKMKRNKPLKLSTNLILSILFMFNILCSVSSEKINDNFVFCETNDLNRIIDKDNICRTKLDSTFQNITSRDLWVLTKRSYIINDYGFQCHKTKNIRFLNQSFLFEKSDILKSEIVQLSRIECIAMVESKLCDNKPMICANDGCSYNEQPVGEFRWFSSNVYVNYNCKFHKKLIIAERNDTALFSFNKDSCLANDLMCRLSDSIIIWNSSIVLNIPYLRILKGQNFIQKNNIIFSRKDKYLFQILESIKVNGMDLYPTTDGFFIMFLNNLTTEEFSRVNYFPIFSKAASKITQRDITNLLLSEFDYDKYNFAEKIQSEHEINLAKFCSLFNNQLEIISSIND